MKKENKIDIKKIFAIIFLIAAIISVVFYTTKKENFSNKDTAYYIINSDMLKKSGGLTGLDIDGEITSEEKLKIQDLAEFAYKDKGFIAGGHRANNNLIIDKDGNVKEFYLLDNPNYSGVTALTSDGENVIAIMNGNLADNTYKNLLVIQDIEGNVKEKKILDIYASDAIFLGNKIFIVGSFLQADKNLWSSKIISYDCRSGEINENILSKDSDYRKVLILGDKVYCLSANMDNEARKIDVLDKNTLERIDELEFDDLIDGIFAFKEDLYGIIDNNICKIEGDNEFNVLKPLSNDTFVDSYLINDENLYVYSRTENPTKERGKINLGTITKYNLNSGESLETPVLIRNKNYDNIIFYPVK